MKNYFSHDEGARNDPKLLQVLRKLGHEGKSVYWDLVEMLYEQGGYLMRSQCDDYAFALHTSCDLILRLVNEFDLFASDGEKFWSESALRRLTQRNAKSEKAKESAAKRWGNSERNANAMRTHSEGNAIKGKESKVNTTDVVAAAPEPLPAKTPKELAVLLSGDNDLYTADTVPMLNDSRLFGIVLARYGVGECDQAHYMREIRATCESKQMQAGVAQFESFIKTYFKNDAASKNGLVKPVATSQPKGRAANEISFELNPAAVARRAAAALEMERIIITANLERINRNEGTNFTISQYTGLPQ